MGVSMFALWASWSWTFQGGPSAEPALFVLLHLQASHSFCKEGFPHSFGSYEYILLSFQKKNKNSILRLSSCLVIN